VRHLQGPGLLNWHSAHLPTPEHIWAHLCTPEHTCSSQLHFIVCTDAGLTILSLCDFGQMTYSLGASMFLFVTWGNSDSVIVMRMR
jgi:hypothetical protein